MPLRIGLVGAGPWAHEVHGVGLAASPRVEFAGVWARRAEAAAALADAHGVPVYDDVDTLVEAVDAVAFCVPPEVQARLATRAAVRGRHLVLDKPIAADLATGEPLATAAERAGVHSGVFFTCRYLPAAREFLTEAHAGKWHGGQATFVSGALLAGQFADSPWRHESGALWDVGPHAVELLDAALGPVTGVRAAARGPSDLVHLVLDHDSGAVSQALLSLRVPLTTTLAEVELFGDEGSHAFALAGMSATDAYGVLLGELADRVEGTGAGPACDVHRGLQVQRVLAAAGDLL
ncbi:MAG: gfo/Idh/MocA family oxidoreductase [Streptosporangiales bacterium]|nr:gfo/Idh/MocA family oxidoreductase [Streptosporangiales bacterium]